MMGVVEFVLFCMCFVVGEEVIVMIVGFGGGV